MTKAVLFVCAHGRGRSVTSEYVFRKMLGERDEKLAMQTNVSSAGLFLKEDAEWYKSHGLEHPDDLFGKPPYKNLAATFLRRGTDISRHRSRRLTTTLVNEANLIIVSEEHLPYRKAALITSWPSAKEKTFTLREFGEAEAESRYFVSEDSGIPPFVDGELIDFTLEFWEACIDEIEASLSKKMDKFLSYLQH